MKAPLYYLAVAALITHELDAVRHAEWGLLYLLRDLPQAEAYTTFVALHVPAFFAILWFSNHRNTRVQSSSRIAVSVFVVIHALIHFRLIGTANYTFSGWLSDGLIFGSALLAAIFLGLTAAHSFRQRTAKTR